MSLSQEIVAIKKQAKKRSKSSRAGLVMPVGTIRRALKLGNYSNRIGESAAISLAAVIEYLCMEIIESAGLVSELEWEFPLQPRHLLLAIKRDEELRKLFSGVTITKGGVVPLEYPVPQG